jgi:hypothetical protein
MLAVIDGFNNGPATTRARTVAIGSGRPRTILQGIRSSSFPRNEHRTSGQP